MRNSALIPSRAVCENLDGGENGLRVIDTHGQVCIIRPVGGDVYIKAKANEDDDDAFLLSDSEVFEFCGRIIVFAISPVKLHCMYCNTL